jgi:hypothetical protein
MSTHLARVLAALCQLLFLGCVVTLSLLAVRICMSQAPIVDPRPEWLGLQKLHHAGLVAITLFGLSLLLERRGETFAHGSTARILTGLVLVLSFAWFSMLCLNTPSEIRVQDVRFSRMIFLIYPAIAFSAILRSLFLCGNAKPR